MSETDGPCDCPLKADDDRDDVCEAESPGGEERFACTRPPGHDGPHSACGLDEGRHPIVSWPQEGD